MAKIAVLDQKTIDKIAAGEVIERPASVVKELIENCIDAGAMAVTVEIKDGGISLIRITDNGRGISSEEVPLAFLRHSTSKIRKEEDLAHISSLGFRGEALSSIAAVSMIELITKTPKEFTGTRYLIEGGVEKLKEEIGAPNGTTFLIRNLFYNTPARKKFLKTNTTEAGYINDLIERIALSHPEISFKFINNNQTKLYTSGNGNSQDMIYHIYGKEVSSNLVEIHAKNDWIQIDGFIGKPVVSRGNRNYENYFVNGRYVKSSILAKAIEEAYKPYMMQHKYPFTVLQFTVEGSSLDVNVHPTKMEVRFSNGQGLYEFVFQTLTNALAKKELIPDIELVPKKKEAVVRNTVKPPEPFEEKRKAQEVVRTSSSHTVTSNVKGTSLPQERPADPRVAKALKDALDQSIETTRSLEMEQVEKKEIVTAGVIKEEQMEFFTEPLLSESARKQHRLIGQIFDTYWLVQFQDKLYIIDQHAAHEKILYEKTMASIRAKEFTSQMLSPPVIVTLSMNEEALLKEYLSVFTQLGFELEHFGGKEYSIHAVPDNVFGLNYQDLFLTLLDGLSDHPALEQVDLIQEKIALMSCKAAVKGNNRLSTNEAEALIDELLTLDNPYNCPHGRPTIISMSKYELERKFKRIV